MNIQRKMLVTLVAGILPFAGAAVASVQAAGSSPTAAPIVTAAAAPTAGLPGSTAPVSSSISTLGASVIAAAETWPLSDQAKDALPVQFYCRPGSLIRYRIAGAHLPAGCRVPKNGSCR